MRFGASFSENVKFFNDYIFTQETDFLVSRENYWFSIGVLGNVTNYVRCLAVYHLVTKSNAGASKCFKWRKRGANKIYWWVISRKCLQDKYQKYNFIGEDCKAKCAKRKSWCTTLKAWQLQHLKVNLFCVLDSKAWCSMSSVGLIHYNKHDEMFRYQNERHHFAGLLTSSATLGIQRSFAVYACLRQAVKNFSFSTWSALKSVFQGAELYNSFAASGRVAHQNRWIVTLHQKHFNLGKTRSAATDNATWNATVDICNCIDFVAHNWHRLDKLAIFVQCCCAFFCSAKTLVFHRCKIFVAGLVNVLSI